MGNYMKYIKPYWPMFLLAPLLMVVEVYCDVKIPALAADIINSGISSGDGFVVGMLSAKMLGFLCLAIASGVGASYCATKASVNFSSDLRSDVFVKIQSFSFGNIDKFSTASLITRLTNDITQLQLLVVMCLRMLFRAPGMLIGAVVMTYSINKDIGLIYILIVPVLGAMMGVILMMAHGRFTKLQEKIDKLNARVREVLTNIRVIKGFTREAYEKERFEEVNGELKDASMSAFKLAILQMPLMTLVINLGIILVLWLASNAFNAGTVEIGDVSAFITYLTQMLMAIAMVAMVFLQISRALVSGTRITEILETKVDIEDAIMGEETIVKSGAISFANVDFRYYDSNKELVLSHINLDIASGETVGIIGSTGCGKTSLVHLIPRLYDVSGGAVYVDGVNVKDYSLAHLREAVAMVLQNNVLFSGSIKDNLRWGDQNATEEEIETVASWAAADSFIKDQEMQYDTELGQGGVNLSGGQKQRLCIARALLKKPKILILDDSTSAVDTMTEATINSHFSAELKDTTKIIIAQRVSSVMNADKIVVMENGSIDAIGTHESLLESCSIYQQICLSQMSKEQSNG